MATMAEQENVQCTHNGAYIHRLTNCDVYLGLYARRKAVCFSYYYSLGFIPFGTPRTGCALETQFAFFSSSSFVCVPLRHLVFSSKSHSINPRTQNMQNTCFHSFHRFYRQSAANMHTTKDATLRDREGEKERERQLEWDGRRTRTHAANARLGDAVIHPP